MRVAGLQPIAIVRVFGIAVRPSPLLTGLLTLAVVSITAVAWHQWRELTALRATALGDDRAAIDAQLEQFRRRNLQLQAELAALKLNRTPGEPAEADGRKAGKAERKRDHAALLAKLQAGHGDKADGEKRDEDLELLAAMADLPEFQKMVALQQRGKIEAKYADFFRTTKLSPEELGRVQTLLADRQGAFTDALLAARDPGFEGKEAREIAKQVAASLQKEISDNLKAALGPERFAQLENYERTAPQREAVQQLAQRLSYTNTPLTPQQQEQLVQALAATGTERPAKVTRKTGAPPAATTDAKPTKPAQVTSLPGGAAGLGLGAGTNVAISNATIASAQTFLAPQQLSVLQRMQQEQNAQQTIGNLLRNGTVDAQPKAKPAKPVKPGKG
jgi:hypothetical protein